MHPISKIVPKVMTEMRELPTRGFPSPEPQSVPKNKLGFQEFNTFQDPVLETMLAAAKRFLNDIKNGTSPYWLSFCGTSHTGKTFLSDIVYEQIKELPPLVNHATLIHGVRRINWPKIVGRLYNREMWLLDEYADLNFLMADELTPGADKSGFERDCICRALLGRVGKWTLLTSNHLIDDITTKIDARLASRMTREGSIAVEVQTTPYGMR
jgi:DNA replication protein DnaC